MRIFAFLLCCLFLSCGSNDDDDVDCSLVIPAPPIIYLKFEDSMGNSLIGNTFVQDSFRLFNPNTELYIKPQEFGSPDELAIWLPDIESEATYFLELNEEDNDTLVIGHQIFPDPCFSIERLTFFSYNSEILYDTNFVIGLNTFVILKE